MLLKSSPKSLIDDVILFKILLSYKEPSGPGHPLLVGSIITRLLIHEFRDVGILRLFFLATLLALLFKRIVLVT